MQLTRFDRWTNRGASPDVGYHMTRALLPEVLYAAGGVERELGQLTAAPAEVQQFADKARAEFPPARRVAALWQACLDAINARSVVLLRQPAELSEIYGGANRPSLQAR